MSLGPSPWAYGSTSFNATSASQTVATLEDTFYGMNDDDISFPDMVRQITEYMLKRRTRWIRISRGTDEPAAWKTAYVLVTLATCRLYVLEPGSNELVSYFADRGPVRFYDAFVSVHFFVRSLFYASIQGSQYAPYINPSIEFSVKSDTNGSDEIFLAMDVTQENFSSSDPYYVPAWIHKLNGIEDGGSPGPCLRATNCSTYLEAGSPNITFQTHGKSIVFTTRNGTQKPDLVAAWARSACTGTTQSVTFNVTGTLHVWDTGKIDGRNSCAILSPITPTASPCGAAINSAAASNISASITSAGCAVTCPPTNQSSTRKDILFSGWWLICLLLAALESL
ncbi:conserved hypothetical protein [Talaromyces marneffei ATCC 18224]|uniref:DUF7136 domain-containing protein n=2 Tax=Talaromyces marneffei TaxID=37727 RepID=B6QM82_TALMQ|nr:conserved hypothetical protein [Talaromyces marneffei ATCC 18224]